MHLLKHFDTLIDCKLFFDHPVKNKQEAYLKTCLWDYLHHQKYYKLIGTDLSRQTDESISQQINFTEKIEDNGATIFLILES